SECINQDRVELMRENKRKLVVVAEEPRSQGTNMYASVNGIKVERLPDFYFDHLDKSSLEALLSKKVIFQGYELKMRQLLCIESEQIIDEMVDKVGGVMDWQVLARLVEGRLVVDREMPVSSGFDEDNYIERRVFRVEID